MTAEQTVAMAKVLLPPLFSAFVGAMSAYYAIRAELGVMQTQIANIKEAMEWDRSEILRLREKLDNLK